MVRVALGLTIAICGIVAWLALEEFRYLAQHRDELAERHGAVIAACGLALAFDTFSLVYGLCRRLGLGDAGRKLRRLEGEVRSGETFDRELAGKLRRQQEGDE